ncbi:DUF1707 SHOCT-like domain-containing protein [Actinokineospora sp. 24-640]
MGRKPHLRVGTADRERAVAALSTHFTEGRIDVAEYERRCTSATTAETRGDLDTLFDDLPAPHPRFDPPAEIAPRPAAPPAKAPARRANGLIIGGFVLAAIALITTVTAITGSWWALAPAVIIAAIIVLVAS